MFSFLNDIGNYESRKVANDKVNGFTISTCYTSDEGYETAIIDKNGVHPVQRYKTTEEAKKGHKEWTIKVKDKKEVLELGGFGGVVDDKIITLEK